MKNFRNDKCEKLIFAFKNTGKNYESEGINAKILRDLCWKGSSEWLTSVNLKYEYKSLNNQKILQITVSP